MKAVQSPAFFLTFLLAVSVFAACGRNNEPAGESPDSAIPFVKEGTLTFITGNESRITIAVEIADNDSTRTRGLMQRLSLPDKSGMLFIFEEEEPQGFWMANTPLSLDIIYVNADSQIVSIAEYTEPYSSESIPSGAPAQFVVEVPAGFADVYGITVGDGVTWQRLPLSPSDPLPL